MITPLSSSMENKFRLAMQKVGESLGPDEDPDITIAKVASEYPEFTDELVKRMVETFNISASLAHIKNSSFENKGDCPIIADSKNVLKIRNDLMPEKNAAIEEDFYPESKDYRLIDLPKDPYKAPKTEYDTIEKIASAEDIVLDRANKLSAKLEGNSVKSKSDYEIAKIKMAELIEDIAAEIHSPEQFSEVETKVISTFGSWGKNAMDLITEVMPQHLVKRGSDPGHELLVNYFISPYKEICSLINLGREAAKSVATVKVASEQFTNYKKEFNNILHPEIKKACELDAVVTGDIIIKDANEFGTVARNLSLGGLIESTSKPVLEDEPESKEPSKIEDPYQNLKVKEVDYENTLNQLMLDDPVLSGEDPNKVQEYYDEVKKLLPSLSTNVAIVRPILRKMVTQGGLLDPFEIKQIISLEKPGKPDREDNE